MENDFIPQDILEKAIYEHNACLLLQAIDEKKVLKRLFVLNYLDTENFSDGLIFALLLLAVAQQQLEIIHKGYCRIDSRIWDFVNDTLTPLPQQPTAVEKELIRAIVYRDNGEIIRSIKEEKAQFHGFAPELLAMLPELSKAAVLTLLRDGLSEKLKAIVLGIFLKEMDNPEVLESFSYNEHIKYTNLMMRILAGKDTSADEPWYPEDAIQMQK